MTVTKHHILCNSFWFTPINDCEMCKELFKEFPTMNESNHIEQIQNKWPNTVVVSDNAPQDIN